MHIKRREIELNHSRNDLYSWEFFAKKVMDKPQNIA